MTMKTSGRSWTVLGILRSPASVLRKHSCRQGMAGALHAPLLFVSSPRGLIGGGQQEIIRIISVQEGFLPCIIRFTIGAASAPIADSNC